MHSSTQGIKLSFKKNIGLKSIYQKFLHSSELVELFQIIFNEEHHSAEELAELLFISLSTLRRLINKAKPYLERYYKISIQTSPYKMVGDEKDIRYFYYQLYQEAYPTMEWPFDLLDEATYDTFLQSFYDHRRLFVEHIKHSYPHAYKLLAEGLRVYWHKLNGHSNETVLDFLIHVVFTHWPNLIPDIRQRAHKNVSVLVFSLNDGHHARMIREMIHYQMDSQLTIDLFSGNYLSIEKL